MAKNNPTFSNPGVRNEQLTYLTFHEGLETMAETMKAYGVSAKPVSAKNGLVEAKMAVAKTKGMDPRFERVQEAYFTCYMGDGKMAISQGRLTNCAFSKKTQWQFFVDIEENMMYGVELITLTSKWKEMERAGKVRVQGVTDAIGMRSSVSAWDIDTLKQLSEVKVCVPAEVLGKYSNALEEYKKAAR